MMEVNKSPRVNRMVDEGISSNAADYDWDVPVIPEASLDRLATTFTLYPITEVDVALTATDSHPSRSNGFLTGCLLRVLQSHAPMIEELPGLLDREMEEEASKSEAHSGITCGADWVPVDGGEASHLWSFPLVKNM